MIYRPGQIGAFEFAVLAARRAEQLIRGCVPRVEGGHKFVVTAQLEVIAGTVARAVEGTIQDVPAAVPSPQPTVPSDEQHRDTDVATALIAVRLGKATQGHLS